MSGLECNVKKNTVLIIGDVEEIDKRIFNIGFKLVDSVTILGMEINGRGNLDSNFERMIKKLKSLVTHWKTFKLSLSGRINIAKSMLYSQVNYLGTFLPIPQRVLDEIDSIITNFVQCNIKVAKKRLYKSPENGGLGLFNLNDFLDAQRCSWIKRSTNLDENWKILLYIKNHGQLYNCKARNINKEEYPVMENLCRSFERFTSNFTAHQENYKKAFIFGNSKVTPNIETREMLTTDLFSPDFVVTNRHTSYGLTYSDFYSDNGLLIPADAVTLATGLNFTALQLQTIRGACMVCKIKYGKNEPKDQVSVSVQSFMSRLKKAVIKYAKHWNQQQTLRFPTT
jgi:hypothetical protein